MPDDTNRHAIVVAISGAAMTNSTFFIRCATCGLRSEVHDSAWIPYPCPRCDPSDYVRLVLNNHPS
jgi:hypothetical protein